MQNRPTLIFAALIVASLNISSDVRAQSPESEKINVAGEFERCTEDAMVVLDASGSMHQSSAEGRSRIDIARAVGHRVLPSLTTFRRLGLMVFGPGTSDQCSNITLKVPVQEHASAPMLREIDAITTDGGTPLSTAIEAAADALDYRNRPATIVVITDGDESCSRDPCEAAQDLRRTAAGLRVHVIGIDTGNSPARCIAEATGGTFVATSNAKELTAALRETLGCPLVSSAAGTVATR